MKPMKRGAVLILFLISFTPVFGQIEEEELNIPTPEVIPEVARLRVMNYEDLDSVAMNAKFEIGVFLPRDIEERVSAFINKDGSPGGINPFDPEELSIEATFKRVVESEEEQPVIYGYYHQEFIRLPSLARWTTHTPKNTPNFRVRFTPKLSGQWMCVVKVIVPKEKRVVHSTSLNFTVVDKGHSGFVQISDNKKYLELDGELFLPMGMNLPTQGGGLTGYQKDGANPQEYVEYHHALRELKNSGGNYFRYMFTPWTTEIEFENLGDYSNRMAQAWEMDQIVETIEELDLRMHFNLSYTTPLTYTGVFSLFRWDWSYAKDTFLRCEDHPNWIPDDPGYGYHTDPRYGVKTIDEFLTDRDLIRFYQNRLRYIISRWGYSTHIVALELMNEINFSGVRYGLKKDCSIDPFSFEHKPYFNDTSYVGKLSRWQIEMGRYIKEDLKHLDHSFCVNYGGTPNYVDGDDYHFDQEDGASIAAGDNTYFSDYVDIISYNDYFSWLEKYQYQSEDLQRFKRYDKKVHKKGETEEKPLIFSEIGMGRHGCDDRFSYKQLFIMSPFSGALGAGLPWHYNNNMVDFHNTELRKDAWSVIPVMKDFFADVPLNEGNWTPGNDVRKDRKSEILFIRDSENSAKRAVAVINNRTVNRYTLREDWCDENPAKCDCYLSDEALEKVFPEVYQTAQTVGWNDDRKLGGAQLLKISGMEYTSRYRIIYHDAMSGEVIMEDTKWSDALGNLKLKYPELANVPYQEGGAANGSMLLVKVMKHDMTEMSEKNLED